MRRQQTGFLYAPDRSSTLVKIAEIAEITEIAEIAKIVSELTINLAQVGFPWSLVTRAAASVGLASAGQETRC